MSNDLDSWEPRFEQFLAGGAAADAAHDIEHVRRVVASARALARDEGAEMGVVLPAAWLHDCVIVPKDSPLRARASSLAAEAAVAFLQEAGYPAEYLPAIRHAIEAHSFSAGVAPRTIEPIMKSAPATVVARVRTVAPARAPNAV